MHTSQLDLIFSELLSHEGTGDLRFLRGQDQFQLKITNPFLSFVEAVVSVWYFTFLLPYVPLKM